jgi:hypothetical protein
MSTTDGTAELAAAAVKFVSAWAELLPALPGDYECHLHCDEADAAANLLRAAGHRDLAASVLRAHAAYHEVDGEGEGTCNQEEST